MLGQASFIKNKKVLRIIITVWIPILFLILLSTLKANHVGIDTDGYYETYTLSKTESMDILNKHLRNYEIGFRYLLILSAKIGLPFKVFQLMIYLVIYILFGIIVQKEAKLPVLTIIIFCLWSWMIFNFSALRQGLSNMIAFFSLFLLTRKTEKVYKTVIKIVLSLILLGISYFIHKSSGLFILAFVIYLIQMLLPENFRKITIYFVAVIPIIFLLAPGLYQTLFYSLKINHYIPSQRDDAGELFILYFIILIFAITYTGNNVVRTKTNEFFDKLFSKFKIFRNDDLSNNTQVLESNSYTALLMMVFAIGTAIEAFSSVCYTLLRLETPFLFAGAILIPNVIAQNKSKALRACAEIVLVMLFFVIFYLDYYRTNYLHGFPYNLGF